MTVTSVVSVGDGERSTGMGKLNAARRKKLPAKSFAIPGKKAYPIPDRSHAANALARVEQHGSPAEKSQVKRAVAKRYPSMPSVVAAAKREKAKRSKKTDKVYSVDDSERHRDIELGSYGSKWRHGWIPLNAAATSLKLKQLRAGGKSHAAGDHQIHVAPTHRGGHAALIVHPDGSSHYVEHASARGALLTAKRHPSVRSHEMIPNAKTGAINAQAAKSEARTRADQITALGEKSPYGDLSKHSDAELKRRMGSVHAESPAAAIYAKEIDRRKYTELRKVGLDHEQATAGVAKIRAAKPSEAPRPDAAQTFRKAMTPPMKQWSIKSPEQHASEIGIDKTDEGTLKVLASRAPMSQGPGTAIRQQAVQELARRQRGSAGESFGHKGQQRPQVSGAGLPSGYQIHKDEFGLALKHNGKMLRTSSDRESLTKYAHDHAAGDTSAHPKTIAEQMAADRAKTKTTSEGVDKVETKAVGGSFTDTASNGKQYDHNAITGLVHRRDGAQVGTMHKNADGTWKIEGVGGSLPTHNVKTRSQAINGLAVAHDLYLKRSEQDKAKKAADAEAAKHTSMTYRDQQMERSQAIGKLTGDRKRQRLIENELLVGGGTHEQQMAKLKVMHEAKRAADIRAAQNERARQDTARARLFDIRPPRATKTKTDSVRLVEQRAKLQAATERAPLALNGEHVEHLAATVREGLPVSHGGRAGHVVGVYGQTFDTYHPPTEGQNGFYMRHEISTKRGRKVLRSEFAGPSAAKAAG